MVRLLVIAAAATLLLGATRPDTVDYRLGATSVAGGPPVLDVEIRLRGDADGETRLDLPDEYASGEHAWRFISAFTVKGAQVTAPDPAHRVLRHQPGAKLVVRYRVQSAYPAADPQSGGNPYAGPLIRPQWFALLGDYVFATPEGREREAATFAWGKLPAGWRAASDLEHAAMGRPMNVADVRESITMAGANLAVAERPVPGGRLRVATLADGPYKGEPLADAIAGAVGAERAFWNDLQEPYFVAVVPLVPARPGSVSVGGTGRGDGFVLYATPGQDEILRTTIAHEHTHTWIPNRVGQMPAKDEATAYWLSEGFTDFYAGRTMLRASLADVGETVGRMSGVMKAYDASPVKTAPNSRIVADFWKDPAVEKLPYQRGQLLALKWDEEIRRKTGGKADLDDVVLQMRNHAQKFPPGQAPDIVTGLVSAAWVVAQMDLRPDIARYVDRGEAIVLPDEMFDGCLQAAVTVSPGFDSGFNAEASFAAKKVSGVRKRGPAWNSGLRDGMALETWAYKAGDMTRMIELTLRPAGKKAKPRKIAYWPYGDVDTQTRVLRLTPGMTDAARAACGRKIGGL